MAMHSCMLLWRAEHATDNCCCIMRVRPSASSSSSRAATACGTTTRCIALRSPGSVRTATKEVCDDARLLFSAKVSASAFDTAPDPLELSSHSQMATRAASRCAMSPDSTSSCVIGSSTSNGPSGVDALMVTLVGTSVCPAGKSAKDTKRSRLKTGGATVGNARGTTALGGAGLSTSGLRYPRSVLTGADGAGTSTRGAGGDVGKFHLTETLSSEGWRACLSCASTLTCSSSASPPLVTKAAVPFPARAIPSTRWWLTPPPSPRQKVRAPMADPALTQSNTADSLETWPSVRTKT
mmetsp:Transcript_34824/g.82028  ORF Transcript_34824/g.82028 Transcript_34824/m.82028 type:complete len:295 (+) Transcript_34824:199-1083(+)